MMILHLTVVLSLLAASSAYSAKKVDAFQCGTPPPVEFYSDQSLAVLVAVAAPLSEANLLGCTISEAHLNGSPYRTYTYTPLNLLQSTTEASTNLTTKNAFDDNGRLVRLYSASDSTTEYYGYDDLGRQIWQKSSSDVYSTSFNYDNPDYPWLSTGFTSGSSSKTLSVGSTRFKVDKVTHRVLESNEVTFYSDNTKNNFTKIHTYDSAGRLLNTTMTPYPDGYVELTLYTYYGKTSRIATRTQTSPNKRFNPFVVTFFWDDTSPGPSGVRYQDGTTSSENWTFFYNTAC